MRFATACTLTLCLLFYGAPLPALAQAQAPEGAQSLQELVEQPYVDLFERASQVRISAAVLEQFRNQLEQEKEREKKSLEEERDNIENQIERAQDELKRLNENPEETPRVADQRHALHCRIQSLRKELEETKLALEKGLETTYDNKFAKLKILEEWPATYARLQRDPLPPEVRDRKFSDFRDVGFRGGVFDDQKDDIKTGREAIEEMKRQQILPPEVKDEQVVGYVRTLSQRIARHSDLQIPLHVTVLRSEEINAFALPGGFLFLNTGLILKAEKESELAGVIAHEIAHSAARHGDRLMGKAQIAGIIFQAAQIAALIFTGGVGSIGAYYALQYGFFGLGLFLNLQLLGVSRDFEIEADTLGTQYLWHASYNTRGFVSFFDRMASEKGYVTGLSWFRTHPPFYKRMERTFEEITLLPAREEAVDDSRDFQEAKKRLQQLVAKMKEQDRDAPTLRRVYECEGTAGVQ